ncbi:MAG: carbohydrate ABC transporter permease [Spirochaetes bacterium]|jgi:raffinose/stachyose/melibiose transport system permease protein|nr:carbohydrate ABC transporter permease [Spirochaetota bacterium]
MRIQIGEKRAVVTFKYFLITVFAILTLLPIILVVVGGFKTLAQLRLDLFGIPNPVMWSNYLDIIDPNSSMFFLNLLNSCLVMLMTVVLGLILSSLAGFALSRIQFKGKELVFTFFLIGLLFPPAVAILPLYIELKTLNLLNNYLGVVLPQVAFALPFQIMLTRSFFNHIPIELEESAYLDNCSPFGFLIHIVMPLSKPILTTVAMLAMVTSWNNYFLPLLVFNDEKLFTLPMGVMSFQGQYLNDWSLVLAFISLAMIPAIIFYLIAQKYIIDGLTGGAVKQ